MRQRLLLFLVPFLLTVALRDYIPFLRPVPHRQLSTAPQDIEEIVGESGPVLVRPGEYARPLPEVQPKGNLDDRVDRSIYGATGTPILSGFVTELGEYNAQLRGRAAIPVYEQMRRSDADVAALLAAIKLPIRAADFRIVPGVEENEPDFRIAKQLADFCTDCLFGGLEYENSLGMHFSQRFESVIDNALLCVDFGCSGYEDLWRIDGNFIRLHRMAPRLPLTFYRFHTEDDGETLKSVEQWGYRGPTFVNVAVPADKFTLFSFRQEGGNFYGRAILREIYQHWYAKSALVRIDSIACERNGAGVPVVTLPPSPAEEDKIAAYNFATGLSVHEATGITLPNGAKFELVATTGTEHKILPSIQHHSEMICRAGLAMFMTLGTTQTGSRSLGNTMLDFFQMSEEATAKFICDTITQTTIRRLCDLNFERAGQKALPYPKLIVPHIAVLNPLELFTALKDIAIATVDLIQPDDDTENYIRKKVGLPLKSKEPRVRYAPVVQRVQEEGTNPEQEEDTPEEVQRENQQPAGDPGQQKAKRDQKEAQDKAGIPPQKIRPSVPGQRIPPQRQANAPAKTLTLTEPRRELRPEEHKHNFQAHVERQDSTATAVRRILGGAKPSLIRDAARRASSLTPKDLDHLTLRFDPALARRLARSLAIAHQFGHDQVYGERFRATGRHKNVPVLRLTEAHLTRRRLHTTLRWHGLDISIENAAGSVRTAHDGSWQTRMKFPYGYIRRTTGHDLEAIDCYVGPDKHATEVYVVHQKDPRTGVFDEDKVFLDFTNRGAAKDAFLAHRDDGEKALGPIDTYTVADFKTELAANGGRLHYRVLPGQLLASESEPSARQDTPQLIAEAAVSDLNNWITSRVRGAHVDNYKNGYRDEDLEQSILDDLREGSDAQLNRIAQESSRAAVGGGRFAALEQLQDEIDRYARSEAMDTNTCGPCEAGDGDTWDSLDEVDWSPGDDCEGGDACRGQLLPIFADEGTVQLG